MMYIVLGFIVAAFALVGFMLYRMIHTQKKTSDDREVYVSTTQDQLPMEYIRASIVKSKSGAYSVALEVPSINIDLMESSEKEAILSQYRQVLHSIDFPIQYLQQSRMVDISEYLETLDNLKRTSKNNFTKNQLGFYSQYLSNLIRNRSVLTKKFYIVIPYDEVKEERNKTKRYTAQKREREKKAEEKRNRKLKVDPKNVQKTEENLLLEEENRFDRARKTLYGRANVVSRAFRRFDISPHLLTDEELLDLFYTSYNKDRSVYQPLKDRRLDDYLTLYVKKE